VRTSGPKLTPPEAVRCQLETILETGLSKAETLRKLFDLGAEASREYMRAKWAKSYWMKDQWGCTGKHIRRAKELVRLWPEQLPVRIPISTIYGDAHREPINKLAAQQIRRSDA